MVYKVSNETCLSLLKVYRVICQFDKMISNESKYKREQVDNQIFAAFKRYDIPANNVSSIISDYKHIMKATLKSFKDTKKQYAKKCKIDIKYISKLQSYQTSYNIINLSFFKEKSHTAKEIEQKCNVSQSHLSRERNKAVQIFAGKLSAKLEKQNIVINNTENYKNDINIFINVVIEVGKTYKKYFAVS